MRGGLRLAHTPNAIESMPGALRQIWQTSPPPSCTNQHSVESEPLTTTDEMFTTGARDSPMDAWEGPHAKVDLRPDGSLVPSPSDRAAIVSPPLGRWRIRARLCSSGSPDTQRVHATPSSRSPPANIHTAMPRTMRWIHLIHERK